MSRTRRTGVGHAAPRDEAHRQRQPQILALDHVMPLGGLLSGQHEAKAAVHLRPGCLALLCLALLACAPQASGAASLPSCGGCDVLVGVGTTFSTWAWTGGVVLSATLELDESRWELGAFRFATSQRAGAHALPEVTRAADPYWGFTAMRRWQVLHRSAFRLYLGFGANYRTELDYLEATRWNFAYLIAIRFDLGRRDGTVELGVRHWSDAWIRPPNRGQNLLTLSYGF